MKSRGTRINRAVFSPDVIKYASGIRNIMWLWTARESKPQCTSAYKRKIARKKGMDAPASCCTRNMYSSRVDGKWPVRISRRQDNRTRHACYIIHVCRLQPYALSTFDLHSVRVRLRQLKTISDASGLVFPHSACRAHDGIRVISQLFRISFPWREDAFG